MIKAMQICSSLYQSKSGLVYTIHQIVIWEQNKSGLIKSEKIKSILDYISTVKQIKFSLYQSKPNLV